MENLGSDMKKHKTWMFWKWRYFGDEGKKRETLENRIYKEGKPARDKIQLYNAGTFSVFIHVKANKPCS